MKNLTKAIIIVALFNILALLAGAGWLYSSGRIDKARVLRVTQLLEKPIAVELAELKSEQAKAAKELADQEKPLPKIPLNTDERNLVRVEMTQVDRQRLDRMKREVQNLQLTLSKQRKLVDQDRTALEKERADFEQMRKRLAGLEGGAQFQKSLGTLEGMKPKDAKKVLSTMLDDSKSEEVISYLSAMDDRVRTSIMSEFIKSGDEKLAADLLELLRVRGLKSATSAETSQ